MHRLFYEEITETFFIADEDTINIKLQQLTEKCFSEQAFNLNDLCRALGIPDADPFGGYIFHSAEFDYPYVFDVCLSYCKEDIRAFRITVESYILGDLYKRRGMYKTPRRNRKDLIGSIV